MQHRKVPMKCIHWLDLQGVCGGDVCIRELFAAEEAVEIDAQARLEWLWTLHGRCKCVGDDVESA